MKVKNKNKKWTNKKTKRILTYYSEKRKGKNGKMLISCAENHFKKYTHPKMNEIQSQSSSSDLVHNKNYS